MHRGVIGSTTFQDEKNVALSEIQKRGPVAPSDHTQPSAPCGFRETNTFPYAPFFPAPPKLSCRSGGLISGAHRPERCVLALCAWLHLSAPARTRRRPLAQAQLSARRLGRNLVRDCRTIGPNGHSEHYATFPGGGDTAPRSRPGRNSGDRAVINERPWADPRRPAYFPAGGLLGSPASLALFEPCHLPVPLLRPSGFLL